MINKPVILFAFWVSSMAASAWVTWDYANASFERDRLEAVERAIKEANEINRQNRELEDEHQQQIDDIVQAQYNDAVRRSNLLADELERMRDRASRAIRDNPSETRQTVCEGATGAELSAEDAGFLAREAARADEIRAALIACYQSMENRP